MRKKALYLCGSSKTEVALEGELHLKTSAQPKLGVEKIRNLFF